MEKLAIYVRARQSGSAIDLIPHHWMPDEGQMDPNLVCSPGFD
jgi:hypothetical protein